MFAISCLDKIDALTNDKWMNEWFYNGTCAMSSHKIKYVAIIKFYYSGAFLVVMPLLVVYKAHINAWMNKIFPD